MCRVGPPGAGLKYVVGLDLGTVWLYSVFLTV